MKSPLELFRRLERELRAPKEKLPIDAFLPAPESLPTEFPDPAPSALPVQSREIGSLSADEDARRERRKLRRAARPAPKAKEAPKNLEDEIQDFLNRDKREAVRKDEIADFLGGFDPSEIPDK